MNADSDQWRRVGAWLVQQRTDLGYKQRTAWVRAVSRPRFGSRVIIDMEGGARDTYGDDAVQAAEDAYQIAPGTLRKALAGEIPHPVSVAPAGSTPAHEQVAGVLDTPIGQAFYAAMQEVEEHGADLGDEGRAELIAATAERLREEMTLFARMKRLEIIERQGRARSGEEG